MTDVRTASGPLLTVHDLVVNFPVGRSLLRGRAPATVQAVGGVNLTIGRGETLGLIGESGSGKSTVSRTIMGVYKPTSGRVLLDEIDVHRASGVQARSARRRMQMIFQNPYASVNRRYSVTRIIEEPAVVQHLRGPVERARRTRELLDMVGLSQKYAHRYPHELSGGQLQRVGIARALSTEPDLLIADEPTAALDVSVRAQVMDLLVDLKAELGLSLLFISHDLATVSHIADRVSVLYLGRVVETAATEVLERDPWHPYTQALMHAVPRADPDGIRVLRAPMGEIPSALAPPPGCYYHPRCPIAEDRCRVDYPELLEVRPGRQVACHVRMRELNRQ